MSLQTSTAEAAAALVAASVFRDAIRAILLANHIPLTDPDVADVFARLEVDLKTLGADAFRLQRDAAALAAIRATPSIVARLRLIEGDHPPRWSLVGLPDDRWGSLVEVIEFAKDNPAIASRSSKPDVSTPRAVRTPWK
jgi:hypothetical protein